MKWEYKVERVSIAYAQQYYDNIQFAMLHNEHWEHYDSVVVKTELILFFKRPLNPDEQLDILAKRIAQAILAAPVRTTIETWGVSTDEPKITTIS